MAAPTDKRFFSKRSQQKGFSDGIRNSISLDVENATLEISSKPGAPIEAFFASVGVNGFDGDFWRSQLDFP